ncbi:MAG: GH32 C-terminal domain-containing protein [Phycisphaerae bacterium]|nr:GH32 C-terminal domain-containing protein [Phycisphaerae bacterium]
MLNRALKTICMIIATFAVASAAEDIIVAEFEGTDYGNWKSTGEAFGRAPAKGTLPSQMEVSGFLGKGLANSFNKGDGSTGTLTSTTFSIERDYINFLIGGGSHPGKTCINLLVDGKVEMTETGPNDRPGGTEELDWASWDVKKLHGKKAQIQIIDNFTGGWGHINIDHIYQSDKRMAAQIQKDFVREIKFQKKYLNFPVKNSAKGRLIRLSIDGKLLREFTIKLAEKDPDFWVFLDVSEFKNKVGQLKIDQYRQGCGFDEVFQDDSFPGANTVYKEKLRPQLHFTAMRGWNNDSNGMMYYDGQYHLFWQHNPFGWNWGNMTWGHAVSPDMLHWQELATAIYPDELGTIYSGGGVVDHNNTAGFQNGTEKTMICFYTSAGGTNPWSAGKPFTQSMAYSNDQGHSWTKYEKNPIVDFIADGNRDPKVIWHKPSEKWVMVLYLKDSVMQFLTSDDLKNWQPQSKLKSFHECPELFELPVDGDINNMKWVLYGAAGDYMTGQFDGKKFIPDGAAIRFQYGNCFYASQTFSDIPQDDGRRIQIAWGRINMPGMPFNQQMLFPVSLTLHKTEAGIRMFANPIDEIAGLYSSENKLKDIAINADQTIKVDSGKLLHIKAVFDIGDAKELGLIIRGIAIQYDVSKQLLTAEDCHGPLKAQKGKITLEIIVDRTTIEIFGNKGQLYMPARNINVDNKDDIEIFSKGGTCKVDSLEVNHLNSVWK